MTDNVAAALADEQERNGLYLATLDNMNKEIATLRAALDGLVAWESHLRRQHLDGTHLNDGICPGFDHCATARVLAAMIDATAKEAGG